MKRLTKLELIKYFRERAEEAGAEIRSKVGEKNYRRIASLLNRSLFEAKQTLLRSVSQEAEKERWDRKQLLDYVLMITYSNYIVMIEARNEAWPYEYMTFSRRVGELWEPFCRLCWDHPVDENIQFFVPPLFKMVREKLTLEITDYVRALPISDAEKNDLLQYYDRVWSLVGSGEVKLELDLHFTRLEKKYVVDFKSGFGSNEKGNTNRLLLVASAYKVLDEGHICQIFVRTQEEGNNNYLRILKRSGLWEVYCGSEVYDKVKEITGFDLASWLKTNADWRGDFKSETYEHFKDNDLLRFLKW